MIYYIDRELTFFCQKVQLKSNLRLCSIKNSRRISRKFRFITNTLTCLFLVNIVCICVGHIAQENNLMVKPTKLRSSSDFSIDSTGKYYISVMTGNFYARYINENIRTTSKGMCVRSKTKLLISRKLYKMKVLIFLDVQSVSLLTFTMKINSKYLRFQGMNC